MRDIRRITSEEIRSITKISIARKHLTRARRSLVEVKAGRAPWLTVAEARSYVAKHEAIVAELESR